MPRRKDTCQVPEVANNCRPHGCLSVQLSALQRCKTGVLYTVGKQSVPYNVVKQECFTPLENREQLNGQVPVRPAVVGNLGDLACIFPSGHVLGGRQGTLLSLFNASPVLDSVSVVAGPVALFGLRP